MKSSAEKSSHAKLKIQTKQTLEPEHLNVINAIGPPSGNNVNKKYLPYFPTFDKQLSVVNTNYAH